MSGKPKITIYIGNLDERVSERVLYDILIQAGRVVDLHIPREKETNKTKGFAFAEYETEEISGYAVTLFSGLVTLYNRTLKFAISGQDKQQSGSPASILPSNSAFKSRFQPISNNSIEESHHSTRLSSFTHHEHELLPPGVGHNSNAYRSRHDGLNYDYGRRVFGSTLNSIGRY